MPHRRQSGKPINESAAPRGGFRQRYDEVELRRGKLLARLRSIGDNAQTHAGYKRALTLLNDTFRKSKLAQRAAVLESASWVIDLLQRMQTGL